MGEVLLGAPPLMLLVWGGGLKLRLENNTEEVFFPLSLFLSNIIVDPRRHNNLLR